MLDMEPGNAGIGLVAGTDGTGDFFLAEREKREDPFSGAEIFGQVKPLAKGKAGHKEESISGPQGNNKRYGDTEDQAGTQGKKEDPKKRVREALIGRTGNRKAARDREPVQEH